MNISFIEQGCIKLKCQYQSFYSVTKDLGLYVKLICYFELLKTVLCTDSITVVNHLRGLICPFSVQWGVRKPKS